MTTIDIVIASYNGAEKLQRCLGSLLPQIEQSGTTVYVVLDGSTDDSLDVVRAFEGSYPGVTVTSLPRSGLAKARNAGAALGNHEWILFLDDDTELPAAFIDDLEETLARTAADIVGLTDQPMPDDGYLARSIRYLELVSRRTVEQQLAVKGAALACRRLIFDQLGGFDESRPYYQNEDIDLTRRAEAAGSTVAYAAAPFIYHESPDGRAYVQKSWKALRTYNNIAARHYYRVDHTLILGGAGLVASGLVLADRRRLVPLIATGTVCVTAASAGALRMSHAPLRYVPGVIAAAALRVPFMFLGTLLYFRRRNATPEAARDLNDSSPGA